MTSVISQASTQRLLPLRVQLRLPMVDVAAVRAALGVSEDEVLQLIDDGELAWAWDIASRDAKKREVRVLAQSVVSYQSSVANGALSFDQVVAIVFRRQQLAAINQPPTRPWLWGREIVHAFNCGSEHVFNLLREGSLKLLPGHVVPTANSQPATHNPQNLGWRRGPGGMPCVSYESAVEFLNRRRIA